MQKNIKNIIFFIVVISIVAVSCKNEIQTLTTFLPTDQAFVRFALYSPGTPSVMIKVNDIKINGANTSGNGGLYPAVVNTPDYAAVAPSGTFRLSLPNIGTANDSVLIFSGNLAMEGGKFYTVVLADTGIDRTVFPIQDNLGSLPDSGLFKIRLVNAMPKTATINLIRIDSTNATTVIRDTIARNISYKSASDYITTPISPKQIAGSSPTANYAFLRFRTVTSTGILLASVAPPATNFNRRSVTVYASGFGNGTGINVPLLSTFIYNQ